ncbi:MAG TPA: phosphonate ABC transporter, permease protein PhnE, partial [Rhabdaerophilum sp.]|nr:phosphonate ABC transporter, permease protein PhnE [Rhabdaerophilum sp.]
MSPAALHHSRAEAFPANWWKRAGFALLFLYVLYAMSTLEITWARFVAGLGHADEFFARMWPPNFEATKLDLLTTGMIESIQIAILATFVGVLLSLPLGLLAARNLMP